MKDLSANTAPVNSTAARVIGKGVDYEYSLPEHEVVSDMPLPVKTLHQTIGLKINHTGASFGWLTVIGLSATAKARWVCRCVCGRYCLRKARSIGNPDNIYDRCQHCTHLAVLKKNAEYRRTGVNQGNRYLQ